MFVDICSNVDMYNMVTIMYHILERSLRLNVSYFGMYHILERALRLNVSYFGVRSAFECFIFWSALCAFECIIFWSALCV